jgi:hypothetical protein
MATLAWRHSISIDVIDFVSFPETFGSKCPLVEFFKHQKSAKCIIILMMYVDLIGTFSKFSGIIFIFKTTST